MRIATLLGAGLILLLCGNPASSQQLKLGVNPYTIQKSALLELNSTNQGLLLARITDTTLINTLAPPDGMVIFFTPTKQLMVRSNGSWQAFTPAGSSISSLNGLAAATQTFATGTSGTDFGISSSGTAHTFNVPDASATARGLITTGTQTLAGTKTFSSAPVFSSLTAGSIPYIGAGGTLSQNNAKLFWDATNNRLGVGTNTPGSDLTLYQSTGASSKGFRFTGNSIGGTSAGTGFAMALGYNNTNNKQLWLGDVDYMGNSAGTFIRYSSSGGQTILDAIAGDNSVRRSTRIGVGNDPLSSIILGDDGNSATPGSYVWDNNNMAIGSGYRSASAPANGLLVQGNVGIGTLSPSTALHVVGTNPLTLIGVQTGTSTSADSLLTITNGLVRKIPTSTYTSASNFWALGGNTVGSVRNFGTVDAFDLPFITNNTEQMRLSAAGNLAIGSSTFNATNPEQLLVQAGTTSSFNLMQGHGKINNYLQINIQNDSAGTSASSDLVATSNNGNETTNYVDLGINSSANTSTGVIGGANNAYLYSTGNDFSIGNATAGKNLLFFTGGTGANERMRIDGSGRVGVGITNPGNPLVVKDTLEIRRTGTVSQLLFSNTAGTGDFRVGGDGGDIFWQGGGGRNLQMGAYWTILLAGDRELSAFPSYVNGTANTGVLVQAQRDASVPLAIAPNSATQSANLMEWRNSSGTAINVVDKNGNLGLGTSAPSTKLHVAGTNPLTLMGVQTGTSTSADSLLTITSGLVRKIPMNTFSSASNFWGLGGNTVGAVKTIGTVDNFDLSFITNNTEQMRLSSTGNLSIGSATFNAANPEQLLVQAGTTSSFNLMQGHGKINNYLQINVQNDSAGTSASSDLVATSDNGNESSNYVDLGINSSVNTSTGVIGGANNAYLYSTGKDFAIGNGSSGRNLLFFTGGTASNERMRIDGNGKVGIATNAPAAQLDVAGNFKLGSSGTVLSNMFKTSVTITDNTNAITYTQSLTKTVPVTGAVANATVMVNPRTTLANGLAIAYAFVSSAGTVTINFTNSGAGTSGNQYLGTETFDITIIQ